MKIAIIGANGRIGQRILNEAVNRGHEVTGFASDPAKIPAEKGNVAWKAANALDATGIAGAIGGQDVVISAFGQHQGTDPQQIPASVKALLTAMEQHPSTRLLIVGGAGSLEVAPGKTVIDAGLIPPQYIAIPIAHQEALGHLKQNNTVNWTYFSPAAMINPGERTGKFRLGGDQLIVGENGKSEISMEDYAIAMLDEAEKPQHERKRFTIGY
jgi:uncharacterized protein